MIDPGHSWLSIVRQCELVSISRSSFYREPTVESEETLRLMRLIDEQFQFEEFGEQQSCRLRLHFRHLPSCHLNKRRRSPIGLGLMVTDFLYGRRILVPQLSVVFNRPAVNMIKIYGFQSVLSRKFID
jgi:hypothetical protein